MHAHIRDLTIDKLSLSLSAFVGDNFTGGRIARMPPIRKQTTPRTTVSHITTLSQSVNHAAATATD